MTQIRQRTLIFIPTYNEAANLSPLYLELEGLGLGCDYLFLDDNSPDGTGRIIDDLANGNPRVHSIHRAGKLGIGSAHAEGISWAYRSGYEVLMTMDCDFTHSPACIPPFLEHAADHHVVVGSRFLRSDSLPGWSLFRKTLTYGGHIMTRLLLGMPLDATGAFRLYRLDRIPRSVFDLVSSRGYSFFFESLYILWLNGASVLQLPISLPARTQGQSKMRVKDALQSIRVLFEMFGRRLLRPASLSSAVPCTPITGPTGGNRREEA